MGTRFHLEEVGIERFGPSGTGCARWTIGGTSRFSMSAGPAPFYPPLQQSYWRSRGCQLWVYCFGRASCRFLHPDVSRLHGAWWQTATFQEGLPSLSVVFEAERGRIERRISTSGSHYPWHDE